MSTEPQAADVAELRQQCSRLEELLRHSSINRSGNAVINVSAGSWTGVMLMIAASFVLGIALATSFQSAGRMAKIESKQDEQDQYLHAIYMMAPQLKPKETKS